MLFALVVGCDPGDDWMTAPDPDGEAEAIALAWSEIYETPGPLPEIACVTESMLCPDGRGYMLDGECTLGHFGEDDVVYVARPAGLRISRTALAHELAHAAQWMREGVIDMHHQGAYFTPQGPANRGGIYLASAGY